LFVLGHHAQQAFQHSRSPVFGPFAKTPDAFAHLCHAIEAMSGPSECIGALKSVWASDASPGCSACPVLGKTQLGRTQSLRTQFGLHYMASFALLWVVSRVSWIINKVYKIGVSTNTYVLSLSCILFSNRMRKREMWPRLPSCGSFGDFVG
jgi:hypothetical protein